MDDCQEKTRSRFLVRAISVLAAAAVLGSVGCKAVNPLPGFGLGATTAEESRVKKLIDWHSGRVEVYKDFRTVFTARSIYLSDEIRALLVDWEARSRLLTPEEKQAMSEDIFMGPQNSVQILLGFYTPDSDLNNLEKEGTSWVAYLEKADGTIRRAVCKSVEEEKAKVFMRFLKWDLSWSRLYLLYFPGEPGEAVEGEGWINFVISGPKGQGKIPLRSAGPPP